MLEQDLLLAKEAHHQLESLIHDLKAENEAEKQEISEAESYIIFLVDALDAETLSIEKIEQEEKKGEGVSFALTPEDENSYNQLMASEKLDLTLNDPTENLLADTWALNNEKNLQISELYNVLEAEKSLSQIDHDHVEDHAANFLVDALELAQIQQQFIVKKIKEEIDDQGKHMLADLHNERSKTMSIQKNLDEVQQMYDQTVKLYNELYVDHNTAKKQLANLQRELDDKKMDHLVEIDNLEVKIENMTEDFLRQNAKAEKLQVELSAALTDSESLKTLKNDYLQLIKDADEIKTAYINHIESLSLQEHLFNQSLEEIDHQNKIIDEHGKILQKVYQDKQTLAAQLQAFPLTPEEIAQLQESHKQLENKMDLMNATYFQKSQTDSLRENLFNQTQVEVEKHKLSAAESQAAVLQLLNENEAKNIIIADKNEEIRRLTDHINQTEEQIKLQFREFASNLETEKCRNFDLQKEMAEHNALFHSKEQAIQTVSQELEKLKDELAFKDQDYLLQKIEMEDISDRLKQINEEKSRLILKMQMLDEKKQEPDKNLIEIDSLNQQISFITEQHHQEIQELQKKYQDANNLLEQSKQTQTENQKLVQEISTLKNEIENYKNKSNDTETKVILIQLERLQEALQQMISEKTTLQSQYHNQLINEKMLTEKLDETLAELDVYKAEIEKMKNSDYD